MWLALLLLCLPMILPAQVVRGVVRDSVTGGAVSGVLVALIDRASGERRTVLTDQEGRFSIAAAGPGVHALETKRIGVRATTSADFALAASEVRDVSISVAPVVALLDVFRVSGRSYCGERINEGAETARLWEEVRAALTATRLSRDREFPMTVTTFKRTLHPTSFEILGEERAERSGLSANPFRSVPIDQLANQGYIVEERLGYAYRGPDVDALLSDMFVRHHCFRAVVERRRSGGVVGLSFEPRSSRRVPDIEGVLWIDGRTHELRRLEYRYTRMPIPFDGPAPISYIDYARMPTGAWYIERWAIRMPSPGYDPRSYNPMMPGYARRQASTVLEQGGEAAIMLQALRPPRIISGVVFDSSTHQPLASAHVVARGTPYTAITDEAGQFVFQVADSGLYLLAFDHPRLDTLGFTAPAQHVVTAGAQTTVHLVVPPLAVVRAALCRGTSTDERAAVVHGQIEAPGGTPLAWTRIRYRLESRTDPSIEPLEATVVTDSRGRYLICDVVPGDYRLTVSTPSGARGGVSLLAAPGSIVHGRITVAS